jgi:hypothetical protein
MATLGHNIDPSLLYMQETDVSTLIIPFIYVKDEIFSLDKK